MLVDEAKAIIEIKALSENGKSYLSHIYRNFAQRVLSNLEMVKMQEAKDEVFIFSDELRKIGI